MEPNVSMSLVTATSVTLSWTQPAFSLPVQYVVEMTRPANQALCAEETPPTESGPVDSAVDEVLTMNFTGLQEHSVYMATVTVRQSGFLLEPLVLGRVEFTTVSAGVH